MAAACREAQSELLRVKEAMSQVEEAARVAHDALATAKEEACRRQREQEEEEAKAQRQMASTPEEGFTPFTPSPVAATTAAAVDRAQAGAAEAFRLDSEALAKSEELCRLYKAPLTIITIYGHI